MTKENDVELRSKFNVGKDTSKRTYDGIVFDSVMEMKYYRDVILPLAESGDITLYELQKPYELQPKFIHDGVAVKPITYVADFYIEYADGRKEVVDTKGCPDSLAKLKRKLFWYVFPSVTYRWVCYSKIDGGWCDYEVVQAGRKERKKAKAAAKANEKKENYNEASH